MNYRRKWRRLGVVGGRYWRRQQVGAAIGFYTPFGEVWSHLGTRSSLKGLAALARPTSPLAVRLLHPPLPISLLHPFPPIRSPSLCLSCTTYHIIIPYHIKICSLPLLHGLLISQIISFSLASCFCNVTSMNWSRHFLLSSNRKHFYQMKQTRSIS